LCDAADWDGNGEIHLKEFKKIFVLMALRCRCDEKNAQLYAQNVKKQKYVYTSVLQTTNRTNKDAMGALWERLNNQVMFFAWVFKSILEGNATLADFFDNFEYLIDPPVRHTNDV
jgi:hypothetical protein